jgi:hypothetical protein
MTPAEYDTRRRFLGLSVEEAAQLHGVQDRSTRRWARGDSPIPANAINDLLRLEGAMTRAVDQALALARGRTPDDLVVLYRHRTPEALAQSPHAAGLPLGAHAMLIGWTADALAAAGVEVAIEWADA